MENINTTQVYPICDIIHNFEIVSDQVKDVFEKFIADKSIPLNDRWVIWVNAPKSLKRHEKYIYHWVNTEFDDGVMYDGYLYWTERYSVVDIAWVFEHISEMDEDDLVRYGISEQMIIDEKEKILSINLGSYVYDW